MHGRAQVCRVIGFMPGLVSSYNRRTRLEDTMYAVLAVMHCTAEGREGKSRADWRFVVPPLAAPSEQRQQQPTSQTGWAPSRPQLAAAVYAVRVGRACRAAVGGGSF